MRVLGVPCETPPFQSIFKSISGHWLRHDDYVGTAAYMNSKLAVLSSAILAVLAASAMGKLVSSMFGVSLTLSTLPFILVLLTMFSTSGVGCTFVFGLVVYMVLMGMRFALPAVAGSKLGSMVPSLKKVPGATASSTVSTCARLTVCERTPVFKTHLYLQKKHAACISCAEQGKRLLSDDGDKFSCGSPLLDSEGACASEEVCKDIDDVMRVIDPGRRFSARQACEEGGGGLCHFACARWENGATTPKKCAEYVDRFGTAVGTDLHGSLNGRGYPSDRVCRALSPTGECAMASCSDGFKRQQLSAECRCAQYKSAAAANPCTFLEAGASGCSKSSPEYAEAVLAIEQKRITVDKIVSAEDVGKFVGALDKALSAIS